VLLEVNPPFSNTGRRDWVWQGKKNCSQTTLLNRQRVHVTPCKSIQFHTKPAKKQLKITEIFKKPIFISNYFITTNNSVLYIAAHYKDFKKMGTNFI